MPKTKEPGAGTDNTVDLPAPIDLVEIPFQEQVFTVPKDRDEWPTKAEIALQDRHWAKVVELVLGQAQWEMLNVVAPKRGQFMDFLKVFADTVGRECIN